MKLTEGRHPTPHTNEHLSNPLLTDPDSLALIGDEVLRAVKADEILHALLRDHFNGEGEYSERIKRVERASEKDISSPPRVINLYSLDWDSIPSDLNTYGRQSASIGVLDGKYLGYYVGPGDPRNNGYERNLWVSIKNSRSEYDPDLEAPFLEKLHDTRLFVADQVIFLGTPMLEERSQLLYESVADELCVFYPREYSDTP